ncbi:FAD-dependent oxidoreductase [Mesorhizobium sp.]|uniref:NAD(P)/FAD-dependent oxidoreductase n=1 Tax=Mesorhizobium sp. TaxID=1871066 RepID=UPI0025DD91C0|nr:FAD-dependent oxidoreductase [Mesorhizobium sp.]
MKLTSYWLDTSQPFAHGSSKPLEGHYDVAVVGGGLTGSSAALALAKKGARVALLDAETIGNAASGRNGGMCNNGFAQNYAIMAGKHGKAANALYKAFDAGVDMVERLVQEEKIDCSFSRVGKLKLAAKPEHYDMLARSQQLLAANVDPGTRMIARRPANRSRHQPLLWRAAVSQERQHACRPFRPGSGDRGGAAGLGRPWFLPILGAYYRMKDLVT